MGLVKIMDRIFWIGKIWMRKILGILEMWGRSRSGEVDAHAIDRSGPTTRDQGQLQVQALKFGPNVGPWFSLPATLPRLGSQLPELYGHGNDPTPDPHCTTTGTDPHCDPDQK